MSRPLKRALPLSFGADVPAVASAFSAGGTLTGFRRAGGRRRYTFISLTLRQWDFTEPRNSAHFLTCGVM